jgi:hypothetical protein
LAAEYLISAKVIRPGPVVVVERVAHARAEAQRETYDRLAGELLGHISPAHSENVNFFGAIEVDIDAELAQLGPTGYRPLRAGDTLF